MKIETLSDPNADFFTVFNGSENKILQLGSVGIWFNVGGHWRIETGDLVKTSTLEEARQLFDVMIKDLREQHDRT